MKSKTPTVALGTGYSVNEQKTLYLEDGWIT